MKRKEAIWFGSIAIVALLAAVAFSRPWHATTRVEPVVGTASSSQDMVPSLSPDALPPPPPTSSAPSFTVNAKAAAAMDLVTGRMLYGVNADMRWPIASLTKVMTAQVVFDTLDGQSTITLAPEDFSAGGSNLTVSLQPGDQYYVADLLKVLLLPSSNEAAEAFARSYGHAAFMAAMNAKASSWGLRDTYFADPSGISVANQSTPREFLELVRRVHLLNPELFAMTQSSFASARELGTGTLKQFSTTNNFAGRTGFLGGKTGTTPEAGDNLVSIFQSGGTQVGIIVLGARDRYAATETLLQLIR